MQPIDKKKKKDFTIIYIGELFPFPCDMIIDLKFRTVHRTLRTGHVCHRHLFSVRLKRLCWQKLAKQPLKTNSLITVLRAEKWPL